MYILSKIKTTLILAVLLITTSAFSSAWVNGEVGSFENRLPVYCNFSDNYMWLTEGDGKLPTEEKSNKLKFNTENNNKQLTEEGYGEFKAGEKTEELSVPSAFIITFYSSDTGARYTLKDVIGKPIKDCIRLLKKENTLIGSDGKRYNYWGCVISCSPELPKDVLSSLGIKSITGDTMITIEVAEQLSKYLCVLSFSFKQQPTTVFTDYEKETCPSYHKPLRLFAKPKQPIPPPSGLRSGFVSVQHVG